MTLASGLAVDNYTRRFGCQFSADRAVVTLADDVRKSIFTEHSGALSRDALSAESAFVKEAESDGGRADSVLGAHRLFAEGADMLLTEASPSVGNRLWPADSVVAVGTVKHLRACAILLLLLVLRGLASHRVSPLNLRSPVHPLLSRAHRTRRYLTSPASVSSSSHPKLRGDGGGDPSWFCMRGGRVRVHPTDRTRPDMS